MSPDSHVGGNVSGDVDVGVLGSDFGDGGVDEFREVDSDVIFVVDHRRFLYRRRVFAEPDHAVTLSENTVDILVVIRVWKVPSEVGRRALDDVHTVPEIVSEHAVEDGAFFFQFSKGRVLLLERVATPLRQHVDETGGEKHFETSLGGLQLGEQGRRFDPLDQQHVREKERPGPENQIEQRDSKWRQLPLEDGLQPLFDGKSALLVDGWDGHDWTQLH
uniref:hypothetical protein n=1 Tax=Haloferax larsenii TaxID=302484 RepID=UPI001FCDCB21|nr:hypothetical protein [Haloferax larsenii]